MPHTAGFLFSPTMAARKLRGVELSDSVIIDPHKGLFLPYGLGVVLVKNVDDLKRSFRFDAALICRMRLPDRTRYRRPRSRLS